MAKEGKRGWLAALLRRLLATGELEPRHALEIIRLVRRIRRAKRRGKTDLVDKHVEQLVKSLLDPKRLKEMSED